MTFSAELVVPDPGKPVREGALKPWRIGGKNLIIKHNAILKQLAEQLPFDPEKPWRELPEEARHTLLHGAGERLFSFRLRRMKQPRLMPFPGVLALLDQSWRETRSDGFRARLTTFQVSAECPACHGTRLNPRAAAVRLMTAGTLPPDLSRRPGGGETSPKRGTRPQSLNFPDFMALDVAAAHAFALELEQRLAGVESAREVRGGHRAAAAFPARNRARLPDARPRIRHAQRRRGAARAARHPARHGADRRHLRARRTQHRPARARQPEADRDAGRTARPRQHRHRGRARRGDHARSRRAGGTRPRRRHRGRRGAVPGHARRRAPGSRPRFPAPDPISRASSRRDQGRADRARRTAAG